MFFFSQLVDLIQSNRGSAKDESIHKKKAKAIREKKPYDETYLEHVVKE